jgi:hypothetical protein
VSEQGNADASAKDGTHLHRAFNVFAKMHPQPGAARDLSAWLSIEIKSAYDLVRRLKDLALIERAGGTEACPLYGLTQAAIEGTVQPPPDARGRPRRQVDAAWGGRR